MKKIYLIMLTVFLNIGFFSYTAESLIENEATPQTCCGDDGPIPPPPPPPTGPTGG